MTGALILLLISSENEVDHEENQQIPNKGLFRGRIVRWKVGISGFSIEHSHRSDSTK